MRYIVVLIFMFIPHIAMASIFHGNVERGWWWYEDPADEEVAQQGSDVSKQAQVFVAPQTMEEAQEMLKEYKARAIMEQSEASIVAYMKLQQWIHDKSERFANQWQLVLLKHPELDYSLQHPTNSRAIIVQSEARQQLTASKLKSLSGDYGLFFVFRSDCPFCHKMAPMLRSFSAKYDFKVFPISQDGMGLPEYPDPQRDNGISQRMGITRVPAVFLVNPKRRDIIPVSYGLLSESELIQRLELILSKMEAR